MAGDHDLLDTIVGFVRDIGIPVGFATLGDDCFLPGMEVRDGGLIVDREKVGWPGDLLHEAGHIAVTEPGLRAGLSTVAADPAEEMAAICWSYAAARAIGLAPDIVFHAGGYRGGGNWIAEAFANGSFIGLPMLQWYGMTLDAKNAAAAGEPAFPHMSRWLR